MKVEKIVTAIIICFGLVVALWFARGFYYGAKTLHQLLTENKQLKEAISNLTTEEQIGYAKVVGQRTNSGKSFTTIKFVETDRADNLKKILEKEYTVEGDIVYFDALIVKFGDKMVMDGRERAVYLWRRVYGEKMSPESGFVIEQEGVEPSRYKDILRLLPVADRNLFWDNIWELANEPMRLKEYGIEAIYGNAVYSKLEPGFVYVFKISAAGQVYPKVMPEM